MPTTAPGGSMGVLAVQEGEPDESSRPLTASVHEANRTKKAIETNVKAIENRIRFFQREEEKIWRDLEEVRRQAATIEEGRSRALEKKLADQTIQQARSVVLEQNKDRARGMREANLESKRRNQSAQIHEKKVQGQEQRKISQEILRQKKMNEAQVRLQNSERVVALQRQQLEARLKVNQERAERLERMRVDQEEDRRRAELEVQEVQEKLPVLEAEEIACLQRLQNSRIVTQSVLEELETSLGSRNSVTALLRQKQRQQADFVGTPLDDSGLGAPGEINHG
mmetsp:Transcript_39542/g.62816  ORF Transcript_39542/g.62816 Transcript_39542/m.62816 type:complete len:282 (+) Transcript_39542:87-932(+)